LIRHGAGHDMCVRRVLDSLTPSDMDEWVAFEEIEPDPMETLIEVVKLGFSTVMAAWGAEIAPDYFDPRKQDKQGGEVVDASPNQQVAFLKAHGG
jgi:hypothetical protein